MFLANFGYIYWKKPFTFLSSFYEMRQICNVRPHCGNMPVAFLYSLVLIFSVFVSLFSFQSFSVGLFLSMSSYCVVIFWVTVTPTTSVIALNVHCIPLLINRVATSTANLISQGELHCSFGANFHTTWWYASFTFWVIKTSKFWTFLFYFTNWLRSPRIFSFSLGAFL